MDTANKFLVTLTHNHILFKSQGGQFMALTNAEALNLACYILALVDPEVKEAGPLLEAIKNT